MKLNIYTERQIQTQIIHLLQAHGYYVMRINSGKFSVGEGRNKRFIMGQEAGTPDLLCFKKETQPIFIEVKRQGNKPTEKQIYKMKELMSYGAICFIANSIEDVQKVLGLSHPSGYTEA